MNNSMQLIEDACSSYDEDEGEDETSSTAAAAAAVAAAEGAMSSKRQLQFMQMWGERRQQLAATAAIATQPNKAKQQQPSQKLVKIPVTAEDNKQKRPSQQPTHSRTFVPSSAWRGLPEAARPDKASKLPADKRDGNDDDDEDEDDDAGATSSEDGDSKEDKEEAECLARADQIISEESAVSVQSLCEAAAAAAAAASASAGGRDDGSTDQAKTSNAGAALREPAEIAALLQNIRLGRRELYAEDSYAVRLERDIQAELRTELDRQQRLDARLDSLSANDDNEVTKVHVKEPETRQQIVSSGGGGSGSSGGGNRGPSTGLAIAPVVSSEQKQPAQDGAPSTASGVASSLAMRIKRRIGVAGARDSGEPAPAPPARKADTDARLDLNASKKTLQSTSATAAKKTKKNAATVLLSRRRRDVSSSSSGSNSTSDSSSSDSDPQVHNRCRWRKSRVSGSNASNSNCSNDARSESGSSRSSQLNVVEAADDELAPEESNSSLPVKRPVYRAQGQASPTKKPDSAAIPAVSGRRTKVNASEFEADPNQSVHLDYVYQSVEQLEPSGAVRIIDPRQMIADLDGGWPTDQLKSAPSDSEANSDSVAFTPNPAPAVSVNSKSPKSRAIGTSVAAHSAASQTAARSSHRHSHRHSERHQQQNGEHGNHKEHREHRAEEFAKPHNTGNSADPVDSNKINRTKQDERGRTRSQLIHQSAEPASSNTKLSNLFNQDIQGSKLLGSTNDCELPVDEAAKRIVAHRRSQSGQSGTSPNGRPESPSPRPSDKTAVDDEEIDEFRCKSIDSDEVFDSQNRRFTRGHHGRLSVTKFKVTGPLSSLTPPSPAQLNQTYRQDTTKRLPKEDLHNSNSSNRARRLKGDHRLQVTELRLALHSTEPHFMSEGREPAANTPVPRRCHQAVLVQSQPVQFDVQLRRMLVNPRPLRGRRRRRKSMLQEDYSSVLSNNNSSSCSSGDSNYEDDKRLLAKVGTRRSSGSHSRDGFFSMLQQRQGLGKLNRSEQIRSHHQGSSEDRVSIAHWIRLGNLPQQQKPAVARVKRVLDDDVDADLCYCSIRRKKSTTGLRPFRTRRLNRNVSHCTEIVDNPSLMPLSDTEQLMSQSRPTTLPSSLDIDRDYTASTVTANSLSSSPTASESFSGCLSTFDAATIGSEPIFDGKFVQKKLLRQASTAQLPPVHEAGQLDDTVYLHCSSATVDSSSSHADFHSLVKNSCQPRVGHSHFVHYMPSVTVSKRDFSSESQISLTQMRRKTKSIRRDGVSLHCVDDSLTLLVACELIVPTDAQQPLRNR